MTENEFSGIDFAMGSVRGFRQWKVERDGTLQPVTWRGAWVRGENFAECKRHPTEDVVAYPGDGETWADYYTRLDEWRSTHDFLTCAHGFYAYFDGQDRGGWFPHDKASVSGVIDGYGEVLIGTRGFRSLKARIVALCVEPLDGLWRLDPAVIERLADNYRVPVFDSAAVMREEFPCPVPYTEEQVIAATVEASIAAIAEATTNGGAS